MTSYNLFDNPRLGLVIALIVETAIFLAWAFSRGRVRALYLLIGAALAGAAVLLDYAVVTNREQVERLTREMVAAVEVEDAQGMINLLSDDLRLENGMGKAELSRQIEYWCSGPLVTNNKITELIVQSIDEREGQVEFQVTSLIDPKNRHDVFLPAIETRWRFDFRREGGKGEYRITNIVALRIGEGVPVDVFRQR